MDNLTKLIENGGWRPISQAPKDGTEIIAWAGDRPAGHEMSVVFWKENKDRSGWAFFDNPLVTLFIEDKITDWMPLDTPQRMAEVIKILMDGMRGLKNTPHNPTITKINEILHNASAVAGGEDE